MNNATVITDQGICPRIGQLMRVHGQTCKIVEVHDLGTVDVESPSGRYWWRVSGLPFLKKEASNDPT